MHRYDSDPGRDKEHKMGHASITEQEGPKRLLSELTATLTPCSTVLPS